MPTAAPPVLRRRPLMVGLADDPQERAADRLADLVVRGGALPPDPAAGLWRAKATRIARRPIVGVEGGELDDDTAHTLDAARGGGAPIEGRVQQRLSAAMGADVSNVRLHDGPRATELNNRIQASAFTIGSDVFFRDGIPDTRTQDGMHLLAHEVAHSVQQGASPVARTVRRTLIPKAQNAFNAATAANPEFDKGRKNTDDLAAEADQEDLARVHGRMHSGEDSADSQKVANFVRAVVLTEYSARLRDLETKKDSSGNPLGAKDKSAKKALYKTKADDFRKKHVPLVAMGSQAPETRGFLKSHGFDNAFAPTGTTTTTTAPQAGARLDVRSTFIGGPILGIRARAHLFIVYTTKDGRQMYFRGGPDENYFTVASMGDYVPGTVDWDPSAPSVTLLEGAAAEAKLDALVEATGVIDGMKVPYRAAISKDYGGNNPNKVQDLLNQASMATSTDGENCNAAAWTILTRAGISKKKKPSGRHPGWGSILGSKTAGKENALPAGEVSKLGKPYTVDQSRELADAGGSIQVYRDRNLFDPLISVPSGTKVTLFDETDSWRRIGINGKTGYVPRRHEDVVYDQLSGWIVTLLDKYDEDYLEDVAKNPDDDDLDRISRATGIPFDDVLAAVDGALCEDTDEAVIWYRIRMLGKPRARELLDKPDELARLAANVGGDPDEVAEMVEGIVGEIEKEAKVPAVLLKYIKSANAANMAMNDDPEYKAMYAVAAEMKEDMAWVFRVVEALRPPQNQGHRFDQLLEADPAAQAQLPNVDPQVLADWSAKTGVSVKFLKTRCTRVHKANEKAKAKAKAEADARARAQADAAAKANAAKQGEGAKPATPTPESDRAQKVAMSVTMMLMQISTDHQRIWELVNDLPDCEKMQQIAHDHSISLEEVCDIAMRACPKHQGTMKLIDVVKKMPEKQARDFVDGKAPSDFYDKMAVKVGLDREDMMEKVELWVKKKFG